MNFYIIIIFFKLYCTSIRTASVQIRLVSLYFLYLAESPKLYIIVQPVQKNREFSICQVFICSHYVEGATSVEWAAAGGTSGRQ